MADDIAPALLEAIRKDFEANLGRSKRAAQLLEAIRAGTAGYPVASEYAEEVGKALADAFRANLSSSALPNGRMYWNIAERVLRPMLERDHALVAEAAQTVQQALNTAAGLGLKPQAVPLNESMVNGLLNKVSAAPDFDKVAWVLNEPVLTFSRAIVDESIRRNVDFQGKSGLRPRIIRTAESGACPWCRAVAGTFEYPDVPDNVYRRHERCRCIVEYDPGSGRRQNVHTKQWTDAAERDKIEARKRLVQAGEQKESIRKALKLPSSKQISIPAKQVDVESIGFDAKHIAESGHPVARESAVRWIEESLFSVDVWDGRYTRFFSKQGAAYVDNAGNFIRTAYPESEFTENVRRAIEVMTDVED